MLIAQGRGGETQKTERLKVDQKSPAAQNLTQKSQFYPLKNQRQSETDFALTLLY